MHLQNRNMFCDVRKYTEQKWASSKQHLTTQTSFRIMRVVEVVVDPAEGDPEGKAHQTGLQQNLLKPPSLLTSFSPKPEHVL